MNWVEILNKVIDYIEDNLLEDITCSQIAYHVHVSNAHLQRGFYALTGLSIGEYVRNRRLTLAGHDLSVGNEKIIDVAFKYGYKTPESFSKAFSRFHEVTPSQARRKRVHLKSYNRLTIKIILEGGSVMDYRIEMKEAFTVVVMARVFTEDSATEIPAFWGEYFAQGLNEQVIPAMGVCGEVKSVGKDFRYGIGCPEEMVEVVPDGFEKWEIPAGTWAIFKCIGAMPNAIQAMWNRIYSEWLPQAKYELVPSYDIECYPGSDVDSPDYVSEIWIPVKEK